MRIGIIGAGPTGSLLAVHLLRVRAEGLDVVLIDGCAEIGHGAAFSSDNSTHLLNVRAAHMSAFEEDPSHFLRWLWARDGADTNFTGRPPSGQAFVARHIYGDYIESIFNDAVRAASRHRVTLIRDVAVDLRQGAASGGEKSIVTLRDGRALYFDCVVLCLGNFPPAPPPHMSAAALQSSKYVANPWDNAALRAIPAADKVLILGSGLTMVDAVLSLGRGRHTGDIRAFSRRGLVPQSHEDVRPYRDLMDLTPRAHALSGLLRTVRAEIAKAALKGYGWRSVFDAVRTQTVGLWQTLPMAERRRFVRHLRPYWEIHRHRLAPQVAADIESLRASQRLRIEGVRIQSIGLEESAFEVRFIRRGSTALEHERFAWIINCSGPQCDYVNIPNAFVQRLLKRGYIRPDALRLGLDVSTDNRAIDANGLPSRLLFAIGPPTRGTFWESTAIPDIRKACARVTRLLLG